MSSIYDDVNPDFELPALLDGWEPWEDYDLPDDEPVSCAYCGAPEVRENPEPFGGKRCCETCFTLLIGGDPAVDPPWRCGTDSVGATGGNE